MDSRQTYHGPREALLKIKKAIDNSCFIARDREENNRFLAKHGMTPKERLSIIRGLQVGNYIGGPEQDYNSSDAPNIWQFKRVWLGHEIYIKIQLVEEEEDIHAICISFHD